jgi:hypothetical protein
MAARVAPKSDVVVRCVPRHDGGWLITTRKGFGVATNEIPEGAQVIVAEGKVERLNR